MFVQRFRSGSKGFTLIELAIVLGVVGVLTAGAWKLMSAGNQQVKDQTTAQQQTALTESVKNYLADTSTTGGQTWMKTFATAANLTHTVNLNLPLPSSNGSVSACKTASVDTYDSLCDYLPAGLTSSSTNPYGQTYLVQVSFYVSTLNEVPTSYSFMVLTAGGSTIPDVDGGRISGLMGSDGGFLYSSAAICGTASPAACGALGSWKVDSVITSYGFSSGNVGYGHIASRTYVSGGVANNYFWLARVALPGDNTYVYNTMATDFYLGVNAGTPNGLHLGSGYIDGSGATNGAQIDLTEDGTTSSNALVSLSTKCSALGPTLCNATTTRALNVVLGDVGIGGQITATKIYSSSDARLKTAIRPIKNALDDLMKVDAVSFAFKSGGSKGMGVTAQNLETVYPELVTESDGKKFVDYNGMIGPLLAAVHELKQQNDELKAQLRDQTARQDRLERSLSHKVVAP